MTVLFTRIVACAMFVANLFAGEGVLLAQSQNYTPAAYIEAFKEAAISHMEEYGCPASVILAIAMHESANGNSRVATHLNNHFGIKGENNSTAIRSAYKGYDSVEDSYADFIAFLKRRRATQTLFDTYEAHDYRGWVRGIARSGYAASTSWSSKVLATIERYELHQYDNAPAETVPAAYLATANDEESPAVYVVKKGDTLSAIARKHSTTVRAIQRKNNMHSTRLKIGQELMI